MWRFVKKLLTEDKNDKVWSLTRIGSVVTFLIAVWGGVHMIVVGIYQVVVNMHEFQFTDFGVGFAAWLGGMCGLLGISAGNTMAEAKAEQITNSLPDEIRPPTGGA